MATQIFFLNCHPENWGRFSIWIIFFRWVVQPPTSHGCRIYICWKFFKKSRLGISPGNPKDAGPSFPYFKGFNTGSSPGISQQVSQGDWKCQLYGDLGIDYFHDLTVGVVYLYVAVNHLYMLSRYTDHFLMHVFTPGFGLDCFQPVPPLIFSYV